MNGENTAKAFLSFNTNFNYFWQLRKIRIVSPEETQCYLCVGEQNRSFLVSQSGRCKTDLPMVLLFHCPQGI